MLFSRSMVVLALSLALILIGINSQSGWLFWLAGLLLSSLVVSWVLSLHQVRNLSLARRNQPEISEEEPLEVTLEVRNRGRSSRHLLEVIDDDPCGDESRKRPRLKPARKTLREYLEDPSPPDSPSPERDGGRAAFLIPRLDAGGKASLTYQRRGLRRGIYRNWPGFFYSEGIIGLARHTSRTRVESRLVVFPYNVELSSFPLVDSFLHPQRAPHDLSSRGAGMDYYGVREFRAGDPLRHVHWKTTARRGELVVREFEREVGTPFTVLIDNRPDNGGGANGSASLDSAARLAASVARYALAAGHPVSLAASSGENAVLHNVPYFQAALEWLAALRPDGRVGPEEQVERLRGALEPGSFLCCIFPAARLDPRRLAAALPPMCRVALVLVDQPSHNGEASSRRPGPPPQEIVSDLIRAPFAGLISISLYRKGDDLRECLEKPSIIFGGSRPRTR